MPNSDSSKKSKKSCILTKKGKVKINSALVELHSNDYSIVELASKVSLDRDTVSNIVNESGNDRQGVTYSSLTKLFDYLRSELQARNSALKIDLDS